MSSTLQNRLVGTIIVVSLVVIVLPEFLDGEKRTNKQEFVDIPPVSQVVEVNELEPFDAERVRNNVNRPVDFVDEQAVDDASNNDVSAQESANNTNNSSSTNNAKQGSNSANNSAQLASENSNSDSNDNLANIDVKDSGWVVQLGSFRHEKNVKELLKTLNNAGYRAYSRPVMTSVGELTKVFVGPELEKEKLELALPHLKEITKLKGKITAFEVSAN